MSLRLSKEFIKVLERISYNGVANHILRMVRTNSIRKFDYNYISIGESNNLVTFTPGDKVEKIMDELPKVYSVREIRNLTHSSSNDKIFEALGYDKSVNRYWYPQPHCGCDRSYGDCGCDGDDRGLVLGETTSKFSGKTYVLFKCVDTGRLSVVNKSVLVKDDNSDVIYTTNRNSIKIGRLVNHLLTEVKLEFVAKDIEDFVNLYKASYDFTSNKDVQFEVVKGDMIAHWYKRQNYVDGGGVLSNSCMCEKGSEYFDIYTKNSRCSMVILYSDGGELRSDGTYRSDLIKGRAILWDIVYNGESIKFMDRVYTQNDSDVELFKSYAQSRGWWYKESQSMYPETPITKGEDVSIEDFEVELDVVNIKYFPYMDTMCHWVTKEDGKVVLTNNSKRSHTRYIRCTNGTFVYYIGGREQGYYNGEEVSIGGELVEVEEEVEEVEEVVMNLGTVEGPVDMFLDPLDPSRDTIQVDLPSGASASVGASVDSAVQIIHDRSYADYLAMLVERESRDILLRRFFGEY